MPKDKKDTISDAVENLQNWIDCVSEDGDCADVSDGLSEIMRDYPTLERDKVYKAWYRKYSSDI